MKAALKRLKHKMLPEGATLDKFWESKVPVDVCTKHGAQMALQWLLRQEFEETTAARYQMAAGGLEAALASVGVDDNGIQASRDLRKVDWNSTIIKTLLRDPAPNVQQLPAPVINEGEFWMPVKKAIESVQQIESEVDDMTDGLGGIQI